MVFSMIMRKEGAKQNPNDSVKEVGVGKAGNSLRQGYWRVLLCRKTLRGPGNLISRN